MTNPREVIHFEPNVPQVVRLDKGPQGTAKPNGQFQYLLNKDQAIMWLPEAGQAALVKSGAQRGDDVRILKTIENRAARFAAEVVPKTHACRPRATDEQANAALHEEFATIAETHFSIPPSDIQAISPTALHLMGCLCSAIDAASEAQVYAHKKGMGFLGGDIRALALSIFIGDQRRAG